VLLDPVSARLYESLRDVLQRQQQRDVEMSSRLQPHRRGSRRSASSRRAAHEIKNPLAGIHGVLELSATRKATANAEPLPRDARRARPRQRTIQSLLGFARPSPAARVPHRDRRLIGGIAT